MANNSLINVATYNKAGLALLQNENCFLSTANKKFKDFDKTVPQNLGTSVTFSLPTRMKSNNSLVVSSQPAVQLQHTLTVDKEASINYDFTAQQFSFNVKDWMADFGAAAIGELGAQVESYVAGLAERNTYRFYGDGATPISTSLQLANALAFFRNSGMPRNDTKGYLGDTVTPGIINSNATQFTPRRNDREVSSWDLGDFKQCSWYESNLLPLHVAGSEGQQGTTLTVASFTPNADGSIDTITFTSSVGGNDADSVKAYDIFYFQDGVSGLPDLRTLTYYGHKPSENAVQFAATADAAKSSGSVTIQFTPALQSNSTAFQNINNAIQVGMKVTPIDSHRCGLITAGNPLFLAMPTLPDMSPYEWSSIMDKETGASLRTYYGNLFGQNLRSIVHDCIYGATLVPDYAMRLVFPV